MTIVEENERDYKSRLSLWRNTEDEVYIEIGLDGEENDPYSQQSIVLGIDDAKILLLELRRIIAEIESDTEPVTQSMTKQKETKGNSDMNSSSYRKKKTAEVHARYTKDENGQLQLMTAV